jgi:simple sugar transport system ATP-binding protein
VLRCGQVVETVETKDVDRNSLAKMMVGRVVFLSFDRPPVKVGKALLELENVYTQCGRCSAELQGVNFQVRSGEILGIAGVDGNGQDEIPNVIMGFHPLSQGDIRIRGKSIRNKTTREIIRMGVSTIPFFRQEEGLVMTFSISESLMLKEWCTPPFNNHGLLNGRAIQQNAETIIREYDIRTTGPDAKVGNMSGGNQQKVVLGRELSRKPKILIACHPTIGLDIGATEYVWQQLLYQRSQGVAILLISTELEEILSICDRIVVFYEGQVMGEVLAENADVNEIGMMMAGVRQEEIRNEEESNKAAEAVTT